MISMNQLVSFVQLSPSFDIDLLKTFKWEGREKETGGLSWKFLDYNQCFSIRQSIMKRLYNLSHLIAELWEIIPVNVC